MSNDTHENVPHHGTEAAAPNGEGTVHAPREGETLNRPVLDGASEHYGNGAAEELDPRQGMDDPGLIRDTETGEKTPIPDEES
ncbi:hypothetical protein [Leucobacter luti]|uniref:hypothetical protein n=1 Tax=Leucobacter luti TaxID=340320 RepID=UPI003CFF2E2C